MFVQGTSVIVSQPVVVYVQPGQPLTMPDMTRCCRDCAAVTGGRCWRHGTTIWILRPQVVR